MDLLWRQRWPLLVLVCLQLLFVVFPQIDLVVAGWFYSADQGFFLKSNPVVRLFYEVFADLHLFVLLGLVWLFVASLVWRKRAEVALRRRLLYLFLVLALGPGLLVNGVFKAESGRARPQQVVTFGGTEPFTAVFAPADHCGNNCSFVSGHASMGFFFIAFAWVLRDRRWLIFGTGLGALVGLGRMAQGAHFLSDVVFSFWIVYGVCVVLAYWLLGQRGITDRAADVGAAGATFSRRSAS
jgi:lipid A 4'-phosphatase